MTVQCVCELRPLSEFEVYNRPPFQFRNRRFAHVSGNHKWEWEAKIANKSLTHKAVNHNNNMLPLDAFDVTPLMASTPANNAVARTLSGEQHISRAIKIAACF